MSLRAAEDAPAAAKIRIPADVDWEMLDKSKFFLLGSALFSGVSAALYPVVVLKTRQQVSQFQISCTRTALNLVRHEGLRAFYGGFGTSLVGTIPARALYMAALEVTKSNVGAAAVRLGLSDTTAAASANAAAGLSSAVAAQLVWTPIDVVSQRLMVQGGGGGRSNRVVSNPNSYKYRGGIDAFQKILRADGIRGLYRGFGISIFTYAPSNAVWWASYSLAHKFMWARIAQKHRGCGNGGPAAAVESSSAAAVVAVQGVSAAMASSMSALITMPLDTIKTRMQVLGGGDQRRRGIVGETVRNLVREGGIGACYRGLGPRWVSMSMSAATMITTYEYLKRLSTKN